MKQVIVRNPFPAIDRDSFLTPFDKMFDEIITHSFPQINQQVGVKPFEGAAYPKVNVYEYDDKVCIVAEISGLDKKQMSKAMSVIRRHYRRMTASGDTYHIFF